MCGQSDHRSDSWADRLASPQGSTRTAWGPRLKAGWGHSRFGDSDVVGRAFEAQAAEATPDVMAGLGLRAVVGAQCTLV